LDQIFSEKHKLDPYEEYLSKILDFSLSLKQRLAKREEVATEF